MCLQTGRCRLRSAEGALYDYCTIRANHSEHACFQGLEMVELVGLEPTASSLRTTRSAEIICLIRFDMTPFSITENPVLM